MTALFAHLGSVIIGLGAAVVLEFTGLLWVAGRRSLDDLRMNEGLISFIAWVGILGLMASGAFLQPNLADPGTAVKMLAVLLVAMNGVAMTRLTAELGRLPAQARFASIPRSLKIWCIWSAVDFTSRVVDGGDSGHAEHRLALNSQCFHSRGRVRLTIGTSDQRAPPSTTPGQVPPPEDLPHAPATLRRRSRVH